MNTPVARQPLFTHLFRIFVSYFSVSQNLNPIHCNVIATTNEQGAQQSD